MPLIRVSSTAYAVRIQICAAIKSISRRGGISSIPGIPIVSVASRGLAFHIILALEGFACCVEHPCRCERGESEESSELHLDGWRFVNEIVVLIYSEELGKELEEV